MKKLKSFLAVVLCCVLSVEGLTVLAADSFSETEKKLSYPDIAVTLGLLDADIMNRLDSNITRGELTAAVARLSGVEGDGESVFTDVPASHPYAKEISAAYKLGIVNGFGDGTFRPDEEATYTQALKLCIYLAGYSELIEGGMSVESAALKIKLFGKVRLSSSPTIKVSEAAEILVRAGEIEVLELSGVSDTRSEYTQNGRTVFNAYLDIYKEDGVITANADTGIYENVSLDDDIIILDEEKMTDLSGSAGKLLGYNVTAYVKREAGGDAQLLYAYENNKNKITKIPALRLNGFNNGIISFEDEKGKNDSLSIKLSSVATIYNGVLCQVPSKDDFEIETGSVTLIDNDGDSDIDVVKIEKYENSIVSEIDKINNEIWFKYGKDPIKLDDLDNVKFISSDNKPMDLRELVEWDVLSVARSKKDELVTVVYILGEAEGTVSAMYGREEKKIEIEGVTYDIADVFMNNLYNDMYIGKKANFYFDIDGKIASYNLGKDEEEFCYLIAIEPGNGMSVKPQIKLMNAMGNIEILPLAKKIELDGVEKQLKNSADRDYIRALNPQLFVAKRNENGEIKFIDTVNGDDDGLMYYHARMQSEEMELQYKSSVKMFFSTSSRLIGRNEVPIDGNTLYFTIPRSVENAEDDDYYANSISGLSNDSKYTFKAFKRGSEGMMAEVLINYHSPGTQITIEEDYPLSVVDTVVNAVNSRGEWGHKVTAYTNGKLITYFTKDDGVLSGLKLNGHTYFPKKGDIVKIKTNRNGEIHGFKVIYSAENDELDGLTNPNDTSWSGIYRIQVAYAYEKDGNLVKTTTTDLSSEDYTDGVTPLENLELKNLSAYKIYVYDSEDNILSMGSSESVRAFLNTNKNKAEASKIFVSERSGDARIICVYR